MAAAVVLVVCTGTLALAAAASAAGPLAGALETVASAATQPAAAVARPVSAVAAIVPTPAAPQQAEDVAPAPAAGAQPSEQASGSATPSAGALAESAAGAEGSGSISPPRQPENAAAHPSPSGTSQVLGSPTSGPMRAATPAGATPTLARERASSRLARAVERAAPAARAIGPDTRRAASAIVAVRDGHALLPAAGSDTGGVLPAPELANALERLAPSPVVALGETSRVIAGLTAVASGVSERLDLRLPPILSTPLATLSTLLPALPVPSPAALPPAGPPVVPAPPSARLVATPPAPRPLALAPTAQAPATQASAATHPSAQAPLAAAGEPGRPGWGRQATPTPPSPSPSPSPGGASPATGGLSAPSIPIFLTLAGLLLLAAPRARRVLRLLRETWRLSPLVLIPERPG